MENFKDLFQKAITDEIPLKDLPVIEFPPDAADFFLYVPKELQDEGEHSLTFYGHTVQVWECFGRIYMKDGEVELRTNPKHEIMDYCLNYSNQSDSEADDERDLHNSIDKDLQTA